jgi:hypothetical protein
MCDEYVDLELDLPEDVYNSIVIYAEANDLTLNEAMEDCVLRGLEIDFAHKLRV